MALDSPEAYDRLGEHLKRVDSIFQAFLSSSGYSDNTGALGRYPHRSATQISDIYRKIDLQMECDADGQRFPEFFPAIPYSLWAGVWVDEEGFRYSPDRGHIIFENLSFEEMVPLLGRALQVAAASLADYTHDAIVLQSNPKKLGANKP
jgi:hypothetical protein